jgi:hypothetical protein
MVRSKSATVEVIEIEEFKVRYIKSNPPHLEAKIIFNRDHISQKLVFTMMNIAHIHGFSCSAPVFRNVEDGSMTFIVGTILPSARSKDKYLKRILGCLYDIREFSELFSKQLDFSRLDLTMFGGIDIDAFYPEQLAAVRDQHYNGSWKKFRKALEEEQRFEEADVITKCYEFEKINKKDMGLVGHKLGYMLNMLSEGLGSNFDIN